MSRYPEVRAYCLWADSPIWHGIWPFDSLIRPGTHQAVAMRRVVDREPGRFTTVASLSDGTTFPVPAGDDVRPPSP